MSRVAETALAELKARSPVDAVAGQWVRLRRHGNRMIGPCPICSDDRASRTATRFEVTAEGWVCAVCADGGDVIRLVEKVEGTDFLGAVRWLGGVREAAVDEARQQAEARAQRRAEQERRSAGYRERERRRLWEMWRSAGPVAGTAVEAYLARRGVVCPIGAHVRHLADAPLFASGEARAAIVHRGPAMVAAIRGPDGRFAGLHLTWIDLASASGKAMVPDPETGELVPARKSRGSKSGGRIELVPVATPRRLVIGEGLETVLAVWCALRHAGRELAETAFWSAVDLGNLGGRASATVAHPMLRDRAGRPQRAPGREPDLAAPGIPVPEGVAEIILLGDGDSDRFLTECALARAAARWARPGRAARIAWAPPGRDFNDLVSEPVAAATRAPVIGAGNGSADP
jgi:hypothetical protein